MLGIKLVRLIERHSDSLVQGLVEQLRTSERTSDFRRVDPDELCRGAGELYHHLGEWLLQRTETDIAQRFRAIAIRRAQEGIQSHQLVWALMLTRDHIWHFLRREAFADNIVQLYGEMELQELLNQFFDRAIYHAIRAYEQAGELRPPKADWEKARDLAVAVGLMREPKARSLS